MELKDKNETAMTYSIESLNKEFQNAEANDDIKKMSQIFRVLLKLGFGGTNWRNEFEFLNETISHEEAVKNIPLKDRVVIIDDKSINRLLNLYGDIKDIEELSKIVNRHLEVAIDEIEEDNRRQRNVMAIVQLDRKYLYRKETDFDGES